MADPENVQNNEQGAQEGPSKEGGSGKLLSLLVPVLATLLFAGGGFAVGRVFGVRGNAQNASAAQNPTTNEETARQNAEDVEAGDTWFFDMESVVGNLNEPGATRYARIGLTLEVGYGLDAKKGTPLFEQKMPLLKNWLTLYMANQTVANIRGETNLRQVQNQITEMFNKGLFPNAQGHIKQVLFKELSIQ